MHTCPCNFADEFHLGTLQALHVCPNNLDLSNY